MAPHDLTRILTQLETIARSLTDEARRRDDEARALRDQLREVEVALARLPQEVADQVLDRVREVELLLQHREDTARDIKRETADHPLSLGVEVRGSWRWDAVKRELLRLIPWAVAILSAVGHWGRAAYRWLSQHLQ